MEARMAKRSILPSVYLIGLALLLGTNYLMFSISCSSLNEQNLSGGDPATDRNVFLMNNANSTFSSPSSSTSEKSQHMTESSHPHHIRHERHRNRKQEIDDATNDHDTDRAKENILATLPPQKADEVSKSTHSPSQDPVPWSLLPSAMQLGTRFRKIANDELGVTHFQSLIDSIHGRTSDFSPEAMLEQMTQKLSSKLSKYNSILDMTGETIADLYHHQSINGASYGVTPNGPCCDQWNQKQAAPELEYDRHFGTRISKQRSCDTIPAHLPLGGAFIAGSNLTAQFKQNLQENPAIKFQFFMTTWGILTEYPSYQSEAQCGDQNLYNLHISMNQVSANENDYAADGGDENLEEASENANPIHNRRETYLATVIPKTKYVVIVLDRGSALSDQQLRLGKIIAKQILQSLSYKDYVSLIAVSSIIEFPHRLVDSCLANLMAKANIETKFHFNKFIDHLEKAQDSSNHEAGLKRAFEMIRSTMNVTYPQVKRSSIYDNSENDHPPEALILYISRGLLYSLSDAKVIMNLISEQIQLSPHPIVINCYALIDGSKPVMYETTFLKDMADQNYEKYNIENPPSIDKIKPGIMLEVNSTEQLAFGASGIHSVLSSLSDHRLGKRSFTYYSLPFWSDISKQIHVTISKTILFRNNLIGVVGLDVGLEDLAEDLIYLNAENQKSSPNLPPATFDMRNITQDGSPTNHQLNGKRKLYGFIAEKTSGIVFWHPSFQRPSVLNEQPFHTTIDQLETLYSVGSSASSLNINKTNLKDLIISNDKGTQSVAINNKDHITYYWEHIEDSQLIMILVVSDESMGQKRTWDSSASPRSSPSTPSHKFSSRNFYHHRLDLIYHSPDALKRSQTLNKGPTCRHFHQISTLEGPTLYLSPAAYQSPTEHIRYSESKDRAQRLMAYLTDPTKLIANPGLKKNIRSEVSILSQIASKWKETLMNNQFVRKYAVRRYIGTASGLLIMYPGGAVNSKMDVRRRHWYVKAVQNPGRVVFTTPYLDDGGAGYIVTLSHAIYEGREAALHQSSDPVVAVMAMDLTLSFFRKLVKDSMPICAQYPSLTCFMMDDSGYFISHPHIMLDRDLHHSINSLNTLMEDGSITFGPRLAKKQSSARFSNGNDEHAHITTKEPKMANDLLRHKGFVSKVVCNSFSDRTIQRYFSFNTSFLSSQLGHQSVGKVLTNLAHSGDHCAKYEITIIPGTNLFIGIINETCASRDSLSAFCPCSVSDRLCLNCNRVEQTDCECPCECPLDMNLCSGQLIDSEDQNAICEPQPEHIPSYLQLSFFPLGESLSLSYQIPTSSRHFNNLGILHLNECLPIDCALLKTQDECMGVIGCEWCSVEEDGHTQLDNSNAYCSHYSKCFGGVVGAPPPYLLTSLAHYGLDDGFSRLDSESIPQIPSNNERIMAKSSPVGPVAGAIMGCFLVLALLVYGYRYRAQRAAQEAQLYFDGGHLSGVNSAGQFQVASGDPGDQKDDDDPRQQLYPIPSRSQGNVLMANFDNVAHVSPYRLNPGYRRPPGGDSDHGYSTMTPHDDSEHVNSFIDPLLLIGGNRERQRNSISASAVAPSTFYSSSSSRISSPLHHIQQPPRDLNITAKSSLIESESLEHDDNEEDDAGCHSPDSSSLLSTSTAASRPMGRSRINSGRKLLSDPHSSKLQDYQVPHLSRLGSSIKQKKEACHKILTTVQVHCDAMADDQQA